MISQPDLLTNSNTNGIGDITQSLFGKVLFGPTAVFLTTPGHWVLGVLLNNQWSVGGNSLRPPVNTFLAQPFINYNMEHGWYLTTSPIITANWLAAPGQQWTVPVGGGFGRVFRVGDQPVNSQIAGYYNAIRPTGASDWQLRTTVALLFPVR